jgi:hypothetical protein
LAGGHLDDGIFGIEPVYLHLGRKSIL